MDDMSDEEFLDYCYAHADTPRCGFVPAQAARLARLAGQDDAADQWSRVPHGVYELDPSTVRIAVEAARELAAIYGPTFPAQREAA